MLLKTGKEESGTVSLKISKTGSYMIGCRGKELSQMLQKNILIGLGVESFVEKQD